jgi:selT/selW/selH-like putative selenoprotein
VEVRIKYCTVCWGYRSRALEIAEKLRTQFGAQVEVAGGRPGQFDVYVDGREVVSSKDGAILRMKPGGLPEISEVIGILENGFAPLGPEPHTRVFAPENAKRFYDRFGAMQDTQFYERAPFNELISRADFEQASSVFELGCGTGRLATRLLAERLPPQAHYLGIDISTTMVEIAARRIARWSDRAAVEEADGTTGLPYADGQFDRFIATYVFDLLPLSSIGSMLREAHRALSPKGKLCIVTSTEGVGPLSRMISKIWKAVYDRRPGLVGGCRPLRMSNFLNKSEWQIEYMQDRSSYGIASEILVATRTVEESR